MYVQVPQVVTNLIFPYSRRGFTPLVPNILSIDSGRQKVIYYLCILLQDPGDPQGVSEVVPLFQSSKPRLDCLIEVYKSCQEILEQRKTAPQSSGIK
ncbi:hypothetical protein QYF61_015090 [Mycteria americana]|uniref:Uncharacterized protein n=1 Tax=Mycteria americana TaxID=33587 RepID=A0AAN7NCU0_MYCAM|nr:hypothetical protein QYF61_015090 [Mycteria americana]